MYDIFTRRTLMRNSSHSNYLLKPFILPSSSAYRFNSNEYLNKNKNKKKNYLLDIFFFKI